MNSFYSTNHRIEPVSLADAVLKGLPDDNGLFMPRKLPRLADAFLNNINNLGFTEIAFEVAKPVIDGEIPDPVLRDIVEESINFETRLIQIDDRTAILELFHGPTLAFKDFGARFMARLMSYFLRNDDRETIILAATSGDTGSAVANGFLDALGIRIVLLYPSGKVSHIQEQQLTTIGGNVTALEVDGVFDDCQRLVKAAFLDAELNEKLTLTSANSINIARLIPQSFYYFWAYAQLADRPLPLVFSVPSGNFGNLTAGLFAKKMGLPVGRFIAATNANAIVPHYLKTGQFEPKPSIKTLSNAMDVGNPSNFARMRELYHNDVNQMRQDVVGFSFEDDQTRSAIATVFNQQDYLLDPHGAVGYLAWRAYQKQAEPVQGIILETAHPAKFADVVEPIIGQKIPMPARLQEALNRNKSSMPMNADYADFRLFLLDMFV